MDLERGIPKEELDVNIFGGGLQTGAFSQKIRFLEGLKEVLNGQGQPIKTPSDVLGLAIAMCTHAKDHTNAFLSYLGLDPAAEIAVDLAHVQSLYMDFMLYLARNLEGQMPVAGGLETIAILLQKEGHCMPWSYMGDKPKPLPEPQWLLGKLLQTPPPDGSSCKTVTPTLQVRVLSELPATKMRRGEDSEEGQTRIVSGGCHDPRCDPDWNEEVYTQEKGWVFRRRLNGFEPRTPDVRF